MDIIFNTEKKELTPADKVRVESIQILTKEKRVVVETTEGCMENDKFVPTQKGKTFILRDTAESSDYTDFLDAIKLDQTALQEDIDKKYNDKESNPLENPLKG